MLSSNSNSEEKSVLNVSATVINGCMINMEKDQIHFNCNSVEHPQITTIPTYNTNDNITVVEIYF